MARLNLITRVLIRIDRKVSAKRFGDDIEVREERFEDAMLLGLKMKGGHHQGIQGASRS